MSRLSPRQVVEMYLDMVVPEHTGWYALMDGLRQIGEGVELAHAQARESDHAGMRRLLDTGSRCVEIGEKLLSERSANSADALRRFVKFQLSYVGSLLETMPHASSGASDPALKPWQCIVFGTAALQRAVMAIEEGRTDAVSAADCARASLLLRRANDDLVNDDAFHEVRHAIARQLDLAHTLLVLPRPRRLQE